MLLDEPVTKYFPLGKNSILKIVATIYIYI